ncbi:MAG: response regulator transcription factor [Nocardioidaceae bacterium]
MPNLLLVEDDHVIGSSLDSALRANGHAVAWAQTGAHALEQIRGSSFDLALLDLGLPDMDGVDVCRDLRLMQPSCVIVMLTARRDEMDVVVGLEAGADDYLTKPFGLTELLARVRAHLRRGAAEYGVEASVFCSGDLRLDMQARRCTIAGDEVSLRAKEFDLLARLANSVGRALNRDTLMSEVWDENWFGSTKTLDVHIAALRKRLAEAAESHEPVAKLPAITTLRGHGYRLDPVAADG